MRRATAVVPFALVVIASMLAGCAVPKSAEVRVLDSQLQQERRELQSVRADLNETRRERQDLAVERAALDRQVRDLSNENVRLKAETDVARAKLTTLEAYKEQTVRNLQATAEQIEDLKEPGVLLREAEAVTYLGGGDLDLRVQPLWGIVVPRVRLEATVYVDPEVALVSNSIYCTGSMRPAIDCGDTLIGYIPEETDLNVGDVVSYHIPSTDTVGCDFAGKNILHRITRVDSGRDGVIRYALKGDANAYEDDCMVPHHMVNYKVLGVVFKGVPGRDPYS